MTVEEIVNKWIGKGFPDDDPITKEATAGIVAGLKADIEQAITAAEEAKAKEEREACAKIADDYYYAVNPEGHEAAYCTVAAREIREKIRARNV